MTEASTAPARPLWRRLIGFNLLAAVVLGVAGWYLGWYIGKQATAASLSYFGDTDQNDISVFLGYTLGVLGFLINGFAPLVEGLDWLKYLSPFYHYSGNDPLTNGIDWTGLIVLGLATIAFTAIGVAGFRRRDLRA